MRARERAGLRDTRCALTSIEDEQATILLGSSGDTAPMGLQFVRSWVEIEDVVLRGETE